MNIEHVAEITGPYGTVHVAEKVIQRLWASGVFLKKPMRTISGKTVVMAQPGRANPHEGPDFLEAAWTLDGASITGDLEIHFYREDWRAHGHDCDPNFSAVALHVVVFPPSSASAAARTVTGREPETLVLLPYLPDDLESTATEDALMRAEHRRDTPSALTGLLALLPDARENRLREAAHRRWESKVRFIRNRIVAGESGDIAHRLALETLGLRRNRAPMADLAARHTLGDFAKTDPSSLFSEMRGRWKLAGVRPANHPLRRLEAYSRLARERPDWPGELRRYFASLPHADEAEGDFRKITGLGRIRTHIADEILAGAIGGTRLDTLIVDALLPWAAASGVPGLQDHWWHWTLGDAPETTAKTLRTFGLTGPGRPLANGRFQGLLGIANEPWSLAGSRKL